MTREGDFFVPCERALQRARGASDCVSITPRWINRARFRGIALSANGASAVSRLLGEKENKPIDRGITSLQGCQLQRVARPSTTRKSMTLEVGRRGITSSNASTGCTSESRQAGFAVLRAPDIPSILVETAFISNPDEEKRLRDDGYQDQMARAILAGIKRYFAKNPPLARNPLT